jgi:hypothetical protein
MKKLLFLFFIPLSIYSQVFPGAKGWGGQWTFPFATADWYNVENLNDTGLGSYRYGVENAPTSGGRIITFYGTSGYIDTFSRIESTASNIYIAGQTSPNGIVIRKPNSGSNHPLMIIDGNNTIIRDIIFAYDYYGGVFNAGDCLQLGGGTTDIIVDRCELYFGLDETLQLYASTSDFTFQNGTVGYAYYQPDNNMEGKSTIVASGANRTSWYNVFMPHNHQRNILFGGDAAPGKDHEVHNFYSYGAYAFQMVLSNYNTEINIANYLDEPSTQDISNRYSILMVGTGPTLYVNNTFNEYRTSDAQAEWASVGDHTAPFNIPKTTNSQSLTPFDYPMKNEPEYTKQQIKDTVLYYSKSSNNWFGIRDIAVNDALNGTGDLIYNIDEIGGWPTAPAMGQGITDSDNDGIPDSEEANYSNLFDYVNSLIGGQSTPVQPPMEPSIFIKAKRRVQSVIISNN